MEVVSSDSEDRDRRDKYADYESSGVREYWIVDPLAKRVDVFSLGRSKKYAVIVPDDHGRIQSKVLKGLFVRAEWLWRRPLPKLAGILKELGI
jgi:Uma2 family endonuclease